ncbi:MAG: hypothetical protein GW858_10760 [Sphingomonadales bacterium]|nr:hypothetical protein [Sphingomonadales bacterium]NCQ22189.1 hypothetical protein [Sphingomonadales bacterium]NCT03547.1 hypothetical protein [Sphingomonadales bacterium]
MLYDLNYLRAVKAAQAEEQKVQRLKDQLAKAEAEKREAEKRTKAIATSDTAVGMALSAPFRTAGLTADTADALNYVLSLPLKQFGELIEAAVAVEPETSVISFICNSIEKQPDELNEKGRRLALAREWFAYKKDCESFVAWQKANPDKLSWRTKPASNAQYFLMWRTAQYLGIEQPFNCKSGEAHDWLMEHGANLRLKSVAEAIQLIEEAFHG